MTQRYRPRRSCLAVPGSSARFLAKARGLPADEVFLDLEDAVAPAAKQGARTTVAEALECLRAGRAKSGPCGSTTPPAGGPTGT